MNANSEIQIIKLFDQAKSLEDVAMCLNETKKAFNRNEEIGEWLNAFYAAIKRIGAKLTYNTWGIIKTGNTINYIDSIGENTKNAQLQFIIKSVDIIKDYKLIPKEILTEFCL